MNEDDYLTDNFCILIASNLIGVELALTLALALAPAPARGSDLGELLVLKLLLT